MMQDLVSVIVPAYNIDKFLTTCVDSLVNQTYTNLEIFLVDDGSTDSTPQLCDMYGRRDNRVHVIHQPNQGQCSARNAALDRCTGDYIMFVDGDDYIHPDTVYALLSVLKAHALSFVRCPFLRVDEEETAYLLADEDSGQVQVFDQKEVLNHFLTVPFSDKKCFTAMVCAALYQSGLFRQIRFPVGLIFEEGFVLPDVFLSSCRAGFLDRSMYYYRDNLSGTMKMQKDLSEKGLKSLDDWKYIHYRFAEPYPEFNALTANRWVKKYLYVLHELRLHKDTDRDDVYKEKIQKTLCDQRDYFVRIGVDRAYIREIDRIQYGRGIVGFVRKRTRKRAGNKTE